MKAVLTIAVSSARAPSDKVSERLFDDTTVIGRNQIEIGEARGQLTKIKHEGARKAWMSNQV